MPAKRAKIFSFYSQSVQLNVDHIASVRCPQPRLPWHPAAPRQVIRFPLPAALGKLWSLRGLILEFYTHSWLFRLVMFNALGHMCCIPAELGSLQRLKEKEKNPKNQTGKYQNQAKTYSQTDKLSWPSLAGAKPEQRIINLNFNKLFCCHKTRQLGILFTIFVSIEWALSIPCV